MNKTNENPEKPDEEAEKLPASRFVWTEEDMDLMFATTEKSDNQT